MAKRNGDASPVVQLLKHGLHLELHDEEASKLFPLLTELLLPRYDGKTLRRQEGSLRIVPQGPQWSVTLECPTEQVSTTVNVSCLLNVFDALEKSLTDGTAVFRQAYKKRKKDLSALTREVK